MMIYVQNKDGSKVVEGVISIFYGLTLYYNLSYNK